MLDAHVVFCQASPGEHLPSPALPASGKGSSRLLPSGFPDRKVMTANHLASVADQPVASRPSPSGALRAALTRLPDPGKMASRWCCFPHETTMDLRGLIKTVECEQLARKGSFHCQYHSDDSTDLSNCYPSKHQSPVNIPGWSPQ